MNKKDILWGILDPATLSVKGVIGPDDERHPYKLSVGTGRCEVLKEDYYALPEKEWKEAMNWVLQNTLDSFIKKDVSFDIIEDKK